MSEKPPSGEVVRQKSWAEFLTAIATVLSGAAFVCVARDRFWWGVCFLVASLVVHFGAHTVRTTIGYKLLDDHIKKAVDGTIAQLEAAVRGEGGPRSK